MVGSKRLHRINNLLLVLILLINLYIIVAPFSPALVFWYQKKYDGAKMHALTVKMSAAPVPQNAAVPQTPQPNQVIIPSIVLDQTINEGHETYVELDKGVWRWPAGSTPDKGGNTILIGHRFTYTNPKGVFYELNEIKLGDQIGVLWNNTAYTYDVSNISQVSPSDVAILNQTSNAEVTLYTCTPLFAPKYRLVIVAQLESKT